MFPERYLKTVRISPSQCVLCTLMPVELFPFLWSPVPTSVYASMSMNFLPPPRRTQYALSMLRIELYLKIFLNDMFKYFFYWFILFSSPRTQRICWVTIVFHVHHVLFNPFFFTLLFVFFLFCSFSQVCTPCLCIFISVFSLLSISKVASIIIFTLLFSSRSFLIYSVVLSFPPTAQESLLLVLEILRLFFTSSLSLRRNILLSFSSTLLQNVSLCFSSVLQNVSLCFPSVASSLSLFWQKVLNRFSAHSSSMRSILPGSAICERTV